MIDLVTTIMDIAGYTVSIEDLGERAGDIAANYASSEKIAAATGWRAQVGIREGLERTVEWFRSRG
jgi:UDP-glucose 4-epimerase